MMDNGTQILIDGMMNRDGWWVVIDGLRIMDSGLWATRHQEYGKGITEYENTEYG